MSFIKKLKKATPMIAVGATLLAHNTQAQSTPVEDKAPAPITQQAKTEWHWAKPDDKAVYDSLPKEYKAFANKSFDERMMMQEKWEQQDYLARKKKHDQMLKKNPTATIGDLFPDSKTAALPLSGFKVGTFEYDIKILQDRLNGKLTPQQAEMAREMKDYGRPLSTVDTSSSYAEQLASCGFDVFSRVAAGQKESSLSGREHSILIAQMQVSESLQFLPENEKNRIELKRRLYKEDNENYEATHGFLDKFFSTKTHLLKEGEYTPIPTEEINGKTLFVQDPKNSNDSYYDNLTRRAAAEIDKEEKMKQQALAKNVATY